MTEVTTRAALLAGLRLRFPREGALARGVQRVRSMPSFDVSRDGRDRHDSTRQSDIVWRAGSLGHGGGASSSLQRTFPLSSSTRNVLSSILVSDWKIELVQPIAQGDNPTLRGFNGVGSGLTTEWIGLHSSFPSDEASRQLGHSLNNNLGKFIAMQEASAARTTHFKNMLLSGISERNEEKLLRARMAQDAAGLPMVAEIPIDDAPASATDCARELLGHMREEGFYRISLVNSQNGAAHVLGAQISRATGEYKLVDANTGEFLARERESFRHLFKENFRGMNYRQEYNAFVVFQFGGGEKHRAW